MCLAHVGYMFQHGAAAITLTHWYKFCSVLLYIHFQFGQHFNKLVTSPSLSMIQKQPAHNIKEPTRPTFVDEFTFPRE